MRRFLLWSLGALVALIAVALGLLYWWLSGDRVRLALEQQASAWIGQPVQIGAARAGFFPRASIRLTDVRVGDPPRLTLASVQLSTRLGALLSRRVEDGAIVISGSRIEMPLPFGLPASKPGATGPGPASKAAEAGEPNRAEGPGITVASIRAISLRDVRITSRGRSVSVSADAALEGPLLTLAQFTARSDGTAIEAAGAFDLEPRVDGRLRVKAARLDVDELLALAAAFTPPEGVASPRGGPPVRMAARVSAESATAAGLDIRQFATDLAVDGERVSLSPLTFQIFGGRYQGSLSARLGSTMTVTLQSRLRDLDVEQLAAFGGAPGAVTGRLTGAGIFSGRGTDMSRVLASIRGTGTASIAGGTIHRLGLVRTVVLFFGRPAPDVAPASDRFDRFDATFSIERRTVRAEAISLRSPDADIVGSGTLDLPSKALDARLDMSLSAALSAQAGTTFARYTREGNRIVLPALIGGTLDAPRLTIDAKAAVKRGLRNEIERRLGGLLDRLN